MAGCWTLALWSLDQQTNAEAGETADAQAHKHLQLLTDSDRARPGAVSYF
jgi:hypothetical protein